MTTIYGSETGDLRIGTDADDFIVGGIAGSTYRNAVTNLTAHGVNVAGYVYSSYGTRSAQEINHDIWLMKKSFGGMNSVFIDEVSGTQSDFATYRAVADYAHSLGLKVIFNPGTMPAHAAYIDLADVSVLGENSRDVSAEMAAGKALGYAASKIAGLAYDITETTVLAQTEKLFASGAGYVYVTEDGAAGSNPWDTLSTQFTKEAAIAAKHGGQILLPLYIYPDATNWSRVASAGSSVTAIVNPNNGPQTGNDTLQGGMGNDRLFGFDGADLLQGEVGNDALYGGAGNDVLYGGTGNDSLTGGSGKDSLVGGSGQDVFYFATCAASGLTSAARDTIADFTRGQDRINLAAIDANTGTVADSAFTRIVGANTAFSAAGQLRISGGVLYGNTDADTAPELSISLTGISTLALSDFIL